MTARNKKGQFVKVFACEATLPKNALRSMADGGWEIKLHTQELATEQASKLMEFKGMFGKFVFASDVKDIKTEDIEIPEYKAEENQKTPSQRLRAALYKDWELNTDQHLSFPVFYEQEMEKYINHRKSRLN